MANPSTNILNLHIFENYNQDKNLLRSMKGILLGPKKNKLHKHKVRTSWVSGPHVLAAIYRKGSWGWKPQRSPKLTRPGHYWWDYSLSPERIIQSSVLFLPVHDTTSILSLQFFSVSYCYPVHCLPRPVLSMWWTICLLPLLFLLECDFPRNGRNHLM